MNKSKTISLQKNSHVTHTKMYIYLTAKSCKLALVFNYEIT